MIQHVLSVGAALALGLWSTIVAQYHEFRPPAPAPEAPAVPAIVIQTPGMGAAPVSPFEELLDGFARIGSTSATSTASASPVPKSASAVGPTSPSVPNVPFKPLPLPQTPPITPTSPANPTPASPSPIPAAPSIETKLSDEALLKAAVVNVICLPGGGLRGSSGSGIMVDPRGIILTVAHVGQGFLLRDYPDEGSGTCYIRTGSPAKNAYKAEPIYISSEWLSENKATFLTKNAKGTGENDFAFLAVTGSMTSAPLPASFAYIPLAPSGTDIDVGDDVGTGSYAAEFLSSSELRSSLYPTIKFAEIDDVYTFGRNTIDIFSVAAGSAAQEGSSGGAVMNEDDRLIGLITTRTSRADLSLRSLQAITMDHLRRSFRADMRADLDAYLKGDLSTLIARFAPTGEELLEALKDDIEDVLDD